MSKFKKGDKIKCISGMNGLVRGKEYEVLKSLDDAVVLCGIKDYAYMDCDFIKKENIKKIKKLDDMEIINARSEVNAEKINEIIDVVNKLSKLYKDLV